MGKNQKQKPQKKQTAVQESQPNIIEQSQKKSLHQYLPYKKYVIQKQKNFKIIKKSLVGDLAIDKFQVEKAVKALQAFNKKCGVTNNLFQNCQQGFVYLEIVLSQVPVQYSVRPIQIPLPCPIYSHELNSRYTIICQDPANDFVQKLENMNLPMLSEVIGYEQMKKNYLQLKDKRALLEANDLFFCDWKIYNLLRKPLGKLFYQKKRFPYPIDCEEVPAALKKQGKSFEEYLKQLANFTYFMMGNGPVYTIKVGRFAMEVPDLVKNIIHGVYNTLPHLISKEITSDKVRQISIKGHKTPSLPIYTNLTKREVSVWKQLSKKEVVQKKVVTEQKVEKTKKIKKN